MIKVKNIEKSYDGVMKIIDNLSIDINEGEFIVITGPSGSGKSTFLNILSGLEKPDDGSILYDGVDITRLKEKDLLRFRREKIGFVFQQYYLLTHLNVEGNVKMGADLVKNKNYLPIIDAIGLSTKLKYKPSQLSGGEQQRVCIARALAKKPSILFLDEPTGALDENTGREVLDYLEKLRMEEKFTMIMVTHNQNISEMANTIIKMNSGKIIEIKINTNPKNAYEIGW